MSITYLMNMNHKCEASFGDCKLMFIQICHEMFRQQECFRFQKNLLRRIFVELRRCLSLLLSSFNSPSPPFCNKIRGNYFAEKIDSIGRARWWARIRNSWNFEECPAGQDFANRNPQPFPISSESSLGSPSIGWRKKSGDKQRFLLLPFRDLFVLESHISLSPLATAIPIFNCTRIVS